MDKTKKSRVIKIAAGSLLLVLVAGGSFAVYKVRFEPPSQKDLQTAFSNGEYRRVVELIGRLDDKDRPSWVTFMLAASHHALENYPEALSAYMKTDDLGYRRADVRFAVADVYLKMGEKQVALNWLADATAAQDSARSLEELSEPVREALESEQWIQMRKETNERRGIAAFSVEMLQGTWQVSTTSSAVARFELMFDGYMLRMSIPGTSGLEAVFVKHATDEGWDFTMTDPLGRLFMGTATITDHLYATGRLTYLNGLEIQRRFDIRGNGAAIEIFIHDSRDEGKSWDPAGRYSFQRSDFSDTKTSL